MFEQLEQYEVDFLRDLARVFNEWLEKKGIQLSEVDDLYSLVIQDFLNLDTIDMKDIFERKYKRLLTYYF